MKVDGQLFDATINGLARALDFRLLKQNVHAANIANANTPEYKALKVDFEQALHDAVDPHGQNALKATESGHFTSAAVPPDPEAPNVYENPDAEVRESGNTVNMEREMAQLAQNRILYNAAVEMINRRFGLMKYTLREGSMG